MNEAEFEAARSPVHLRSALLFAPLLGAPSPMVREVELRVTAANDVVSTDLERKIALQLGDRLLQDGYRVVPSGDLDHMRVWIHLDPRGATIEASGDEIRVEHVNAGDARLMSLEILQLTSALLDEVQPTTEPKSVGLVLQVDDDVTDPLLREQLQAGLLRRGFTLTRRPLEDDLRLCVSESERGLTAHVVPSDAPCEITAKTRVETVPAADGDELQQERFLDRVEAAVRTQPTETTEPIVAPVRSAPRRTAPPTPPSPETPLQWTDLNVGLTAAAGVAVRARTVDAVVGTRVRVGRRHGPGGGIGLRLIPSRAENLRVYEVLPSAEFDWRIRLTGHATAELGLSGGVLLHNYVQTSASGKRGVRAAPNVGATLRFMYQADSGMLLFAGARGGWSGGNWVHVCSFEPCWSRTAWLAGAELGMGWDFARWRDR